MTHQPLLAIHPAFDEASIGQLVRIFYGRARADEVIGPIFADAVSDWDVHIGRIADFWSSVLLRTGRYDGRPMRPHLILPLEERHFDRWLALFESTAREIYPADAAMLVIERARRIADSFEMAIGVQRGEIRRPRHAGGAQ